MFSILYFSIKFLISDSLRQFKNSCLIILYVSQFPDKISYSFYQMFLWSTFIFIFLNILINQRSLRSLSIICNIWIIYLLASNVYFFLLIIGHVALPVCISNYSFIIWQKLCLEEPQNLQMMFSSTGAVFPFLFLGRWEADNLKLICDSAGWGLDEVLVGYMRSVPRLFLFLNHETPWTLIENLVDLYLLNPERTQEVLFHKLSAYFLRPKKQLKNLASVFKEEFSSVFEFSISLPPSPFICLFPKYQKSTEAFILSFRIF